MQVEDIVDRLNANRERYEQKYEKKKAAEPSDNCDETKKPAVSFGNGSIIVSPSEEIGGCYGIR